MNPFWSKPIFLTWQTLTNTNPLDINLLIPFQVSESPSTGNACDKRVRWLKLITVFEAWLKIQNPATLHAGRALCLDEGLKQDYGFRVRAWSWYMWATWESLETRCPEVASPMQDSVLLCCLHTHTHTLFRCAFILDFLAMYSSCR